MKKKKITFFFSHHIYSTKSGDVCLLNSKEIGGMEKKEKIFNNCNFGFFLVPELCLRSMCKARSAWLLSMSGVKSVLLPAMYKTNLETLLRT